MHDLSEDGKVPFIKNWLGREWLQFIQTISNAEKEACNSTTGLFYVLKEEFRPQPNETILSLQCCKLHRKENESTHEWVGRFCIEEPECSYKEPDRWLTEQFINGINEEEITQEIIKELIV